ncbi:hypothetical protein [Aporhodopirellula aestuarii]|uniref:XRE family transcriptional regulator n=1 Tax=Aporhodopirellula aestuarii TaxID=2950107 RepID=A0ABT0U5G3_9BACT|nr:hypothetical protein [Aporhodopirellula aestuarii]MCM2371904.1 hypothetical protein [Aporhodopirellula aestuarii]
MNNDRSDLPGLIEMLNSESYQESRKRDFNQQSLEERILSFLGSCDQRGHQYRPGHDCRPTIKRLATFLGCDPTAISKLKTGHRKQINFDAMNTLAILSGVCPPVPFEELGAEKRARLADADRWCEEAPERRGTLAEFLMKGIGSRQDN